MSETPEQRRRRLRWLTLGEIIAVIAVAISALGLWKSWQDERRKAGGGREASDRPADPSRNCQERRSLAPG